MRLRPSWMANESISTVDNHGNQSISRWKNEKQLIQTKKRNTNERRDQYKNISVTFIYPFDEEKRAYEISSERNQIYDVFD